MKRLPRLFEMDGVQRCSVCKASFPMNTQHSVHKAFEEHMRRAHQPCPTNQGINSSAQETSVASRTPGADFAAMPDDPPRSLCPVPTSKGVTMYTCGLCAWVFRVEGSDMTAGQAAFDAHRCEDFPREE